jgi:hypothetical protein
MTFCLFILLAVTRQYVQVGLYHFCVVMCRVIILKTIIPTYFLFGCLCYIRSVLLGVSYAVYWGACKIHMQ